MKEWIISVVSIIIVITLIGILVPKGKLSGIINSFLSVIFLLTVFSPVISGKISIDCNYVAGTGGDADLQSGYLYYVMQSRCEDIKTACIESLESSGIKDAVKEIRYTVDAYGLKIKSVTVILNDSVINGKDEHINIIEEIEKTVTECFGTDMVTVKKNE